jgi:hypothetical protein
VHSYLIAGAMLAVVTALAVGWKWQLSVLGSVVFALAVGMSVAIVLTVAEPIMHPTPVVGALVMWGATIGIGLAAQRRHPLDSHNRSLPSRFPPV